VISIVMTVALIRTGGPPAPAALRLVLFVLAGFVLAAALCAVGIWWLVTRRKGVWSRIPRSRQWRHAWVIFGIVGGVHALFGLWWASRF
jgi:hypothetical protein